MHINSAIAFPGDGAADIVANAQCPMSFPLALPQGITARSGIARASTSPLLYHVDKTVVTERVVEAFFKPVSRNSAGS